MPRFRLANFLRFEPELARVTARQTMHIKPQMNHFVLQNFPQRLVARSAKHAAHLEPRAVVPNVEQQRNRKRDLFRFNANVARRARQTTAPTDGTKRQDAAEKLAVEAVIKRLKLLR